MVKIALFHTGGHTETGALLPFLKKISDNLEFERCFPCCNKPGPKIGRLSPTPDPAHSGYTGQALIRAMFAILSDKTFSIEADIVLLVDDADCRFASQKDYKKHCGNLKKEVIKKFGREVTFIALFASPEIEAWLITDWNNSFHKQYGPEVATKLKMVWKRELKRESEERIIPDKTTIEGYGHPKHIGSCKNKLSSFIQSAVRELGRKYSKRYDGVEMLANLDPATVAESCVTYFKPAYNALRDVAKN